MIYVLLFFTIICSFWTILLINSSVAKSSLVAIWNLVKNDTRSPVVSIMPSLIMAVISAIGWVVILIFI